MKPLFEIDLVIWGRKVTFPLYLVMRKKGDCSLLFLLLFSFLIFRECLVLLQVFLIISFTCFLPSHCSCIILCGFFLLKQYLTFQVTGLGVCVQVVKNNLAPAMKKAELEIQFGRGFCRESEVLELACEQGIIVKEGSNYLIEGDVFSGKLEAEHYLAENDEILDKIVMILRRQLVERESL